MTIGNLSKHEFVHILKNSLSPSSPIQSTEQLFGREKPFREIEQELCAEGRQCFIYGDRGVGKTSLAQTAAYSLQSSKRDPIFVGCDAETKCFNIVKHIAERIIAQSIGSKTVTTHKASIKFSGLSYEIQKQIEAGKIPDIIDVNSATSIFKFLSENYSENTIIVIDEFDLIRNDEERVHFSNLIKNIGDNKINIKLIFCGIGRSLDKLYYSHGSAHRYLVGLPLDRLNYSNRFEIIDKSAEALGVSVGEPFRFRIASLSDGFPHYIHLVCEKLYWAMFNDSRKCTKAELDHYNEAINDAVRGMELQLKKHYDLAILHKTNDYEEVLWAAADHSDLFRHSSDIYNSYCDITNGLERSPLSYQKFINRLSRLRSEKCGKILKLYMDRNGWYEFSENFIRGYVRLRAEEKGVSLGLDYTPGKDYYNPLSKARIGLLFPRKIYK